MTKTVILTNCLKCKLCGKVIHSKYTHDYKTCDCGFISVDGGTDYLKRGYDTKKIKDKFEEGHIITYEEASEYFEDLSTWEEIYNAD